MKRAELRPLTSLRFFASAAIVVHHLRGAFGLDLPALPFSHAVPFFFALSGFVLTYNYFGLPNAQRAEYYVARVARIWPLHIICLLIGFVLLLPNYASYLRTDDGWLILLCNILLVHDWVPDYRYAFYFNGVSWSISAELFFYLLFPFFVTSTRRMLGALAAFCALNAIVFYVGRDTISDLTVPLFQTSGWLVYPQMHPVALVPIFLVGMLTAVAYARCEAIRLGSSVATALETVAVVLIVAWAAWGYGHFAPRDLGTVAARFYIHNGFAMLAPLILLVFALGQGLLSKALSWTPLVVLGRASFATYLIHQIIIAKAATAGLDKTLGTGLAVAGIVVCVYLASLLLHYGVEEPARRVIQQRWRQRSLRTSTA